MVVEYEIFYNDGTEYGTMRFRNKTQTYIEEAILHEIQNNNKNSNPEYHISRDSFKLKTRFMKSEDHCSNCGNKLDEKGKGFCSDKCEEIYNNL